MAFASCPAFRFSSVKQFQQQVYGFVVSLFQFELLDMLNIISEMCPIHQSGFADAISLGDKRLYKLVAEFVEFIEVVVFEFPNEDGAVLGNVGMKDTRPLFGQMANDVPFRSQRLGDLNNHGSIVKLIHGLFHHWAAGKAQPVRFQTEIPADIFHQIVPVKNRITNVMDSFHFHALPRPVHKRGLAIVYYARHPSAIWKG